MFAANWKTWKLIGVGVIPGRCVILDQPAVISESEKYWRFGHGAAIEIAASNSRGKNPFPKMAHALAFTIDALPLLKWIWTKLSNKRNGPYQLIIILIESSVQSEEKLHSFLLAVRILARALTQKPLTFKKNKSWAWMGGHSSKKGNVEETRTWWNCRVECFWDPEACSNSLEQFDWRLI